MTTLRRGLLKDIRAVFQNAQDMVRTGDPSTWTDQETELAVLEGEVLGLLRGIAYTERQHRITCEGMNATIDSLVFQKATLEAARVAALHASLATAGPYAFELGAKVTNHRGEHGTVEAISRDYGYPRNITYGVAIEHKGGLYYYPAHQLDSRP